jgi:peptide/nickel transport system substrate-binding protein
MLRTRRVFAATLFILLVTMFTTGSLISAQSDQQRIIYGLTLNVSGIDPHINQNTELGIVLRSVYDTLVYRDPTTKEIVPGLAKTWEISEDGLTYTFTLRDDVVFHDGTFFNSDAVAKNIERVMAADTGSQRARLLLGPLVSYQIVDNYTFRFILAEPYSALLDALSQVYLGMASPKTFEEFGILRYQFHQVGTGPFIFVEYVPEDRIVIRRNPDYKWGPAFYVDPGENAIQEVEFRFFRDPATRALALESGEAQVMGELLPTDARVLANNPAFKLAPAAVPGQPLQFYMNTQRAPTNDLAVRQALLYASNRTAIVDAVYQGFSTVAWGPLTAATDFYNPGVVNAYAYNIEQARTLLANAGYVDTDRDGILDQNGEPLEITIIQPPWGLVPEVAQFLQDQWESLGIRVVIEPVPGFTSLLEEVQTGEYNLVSFDQFGLDPAILDARFLSDGTANWTGYGNADLDQLLSSASREGDAEQRRALYGQAQALIMEQALILPVRDYINLNAYTARIDNLVYDPYGWFPLLYNATYIPE